MQRFEWHTTEYPTTAQVSCIFWYTHEPLGECVYQENTNDKWCILWYSIREHYIAILYHTIKKQ